MATLCGRLAGSLVVGSALLAGCSADTEPPPPLTTTTVECGLVVVPDSASYAQYSIDDAKYWDVTLAVLENPCSHSLDVIAVEPGAAMDVEGHGVSVSPPPEMVFAAAAAPARPLAALRPVGVGAGDRVQIIGRFALAGDEPVHIPPATLTFRGDHRTGSLTLTPKVSLCTCPPPG